MGLIKGSQLPFSLKNNMMKLYPSYIASKNNTRMNSNILLEVSPFLSHRKITIKSTTSLLQSSKSLQPFLISTIKINSICCQSALFHTWIQYLIVFNRLIPQFLALLHLSLQAIIKLKSLKKLVRGQMLEPSMLILGK